MKDNDRFSLGKRPPTGLFVCRIYWTRSTRPLHHLEYSPRGILWAPEILFHAKSKLPADYAGNTLQMLRWYTCTCNVGLIDLFAYRKKNGFHFRDFYLLFRKICNNLGLRVILRSQNGALYFFIGNFLLLRDAFFLCQQIVLFN